MGVDVKDIQILILRFLKFSMDTCCRLVQKYPCSSGVLLFLFILYLFLPSVFYFLIYSIPFVLCTAVFLYFYLGLHHPKNPNFLKDDKEGNITSSTTSESQEADIAANEDGDSSTQTQRTLQRNVNENNEESNRQTIKEEKDMVSTKICDDHIIDGNTLLDEKRRVIIEEKASSSLDHGESSSHNASIGEDLASLGGASSSEEEEDEGARGHGNEAVEWTENDQKNLTDLGISELERNRRLESLIARRRARKSLKLYAEKNQMKTDYNPPGQMASLLFARSNPFHVKSSRDEQMPGSAPSVLLPNRNPFDIPYDSNEEKPDLTADSFNQEFTAPQQKDMFFCRHQSFFLGPSFPLEGMEDQRGVSGYSLFKRQLGNGDHDKLVENLFLRGGEYLRRAITASNVETEGQYPNQVKEIPEEDGETRCERRENDDDIDLGSDHESEIQTEIKAIKSSKSQSSPSYSLEDKEQVFNSDKSEVAEHQQPTAFQFPDTLDRVTPNTLPFPFPKARAGNEPSSDSSISAIDKPGIQDHLFYGKRATCHTPSNSIASDLQVEVSEVGSPPLTADGTASSIDGESLTYDGDSEKEITSGSDEMWGVSPHAPRVGRDHEITPMESNGHNDITKGEIPSIGREPEDPVPLSMESLSSSGTEIPQKEKGHSMNSDDKISNDVKEIVPPKSFLEGSDSMDGSMTQTFLDKPQESLNPPEDPAEEVNIDYNVDNTEASSPNLKDLALTKGRNVGKEDGNVGEVTGDLSKLVESSNLEPNNYVGNKELDTPERSIQQVNHYMEDLKSNEERDGGTENSMKHEVELDPAKVAAESRSESGKYAEIHFTQRIANLAISESAKPTVESKNLKPFEDPEGTTEKLAESEHMMDSLISTQESKEEQSAMEVGVSGLSQSFDNDPITSAMQPQSETEPVSTNPSTSSSPKSVLPDSIPTSVAPLAYATQSVLPDSIPTSEAPLANATQSIHTNVSESYMDESRNRLSDEPTSENIVLTAPQIAQKAADDSADRPDVHTNSEKSEDQHNPLQNSTSKVDIIHYDILGENEGESQRPDSQKEVIEPSNSTEVHPPDSTITNEGEPKELNKDEAKHMETVEEINIEANDKEEH